jgi:hypothetical protein
VNIHRKREPPRKEYGNDRSQSISTARPQRQNFERETKKHPEGLNESENFCLGKGESQETGLSCCQFPPLKSPMTSTVMAVRSSLRVSVRREEEPEQTNDNEDSRPSPSKRPRLNPPSRRRKSSPDLLDTTTVESPSKTTPNHIRRAPSSLPRRSSARRPLLSPSHHPSPDTPHTTTQLPLHCNESPATTPAPWLSRESPDPLDTISPAITDAKRFPARTTTTPSTRRCRIADASSPLPESTAAQNRGQGAERPAEPSSDSTATPSQQPAPAQITPATRERRSLRSHDGGSRAKSELALYFPNYEQLLSLEPPKTGKPQYTSSH